MKLLDLTLESPAGNLACDEALLDLCDEEGEEVLRFWESRQHFVVVGYGNRIEREVNVEECRRRGVPILRRCSGGGTVLQGPGCLNFSVTLQIARDKLLATVTGTNRFVMQRNRGAMEALLDRRISVQGHTDLAFEYGTRWFKFSGNAQRRRRQGLLFHGTILYDFDVALMGELLRFPPVQPQYRANRSHADFVGNVPVSQSALCDGLRRAWQAQGTFTPVPIQRIEQLCREHYENDVWNLRRPH